MEVRQASMECCPGEAALVSMKDLTSPQAFQSPAPFLSSPFNPTHWLHPNTNPEGHSHPPLQERQTRDRSCEDEQGLKANRLNSPKKQQPQWVGDKGTTAPGGLYTGNFNLTSINKTKCLFTPKNSNTGSFTYEGQSIYTQQGVAGL